jgi:2',3'-cyclic-nucleotide 2'-phosphodiesterase (5'-nucleotidase family)
VRERETELGDMVADSMAWTTKRLGVDFAIQNGGGIRAELTKGKITGEMIHEILPFDDTVVVLTMKGSDLQALFDHIAKVSRGSGAFPQISKGLQFTIEGETGRCRDILIKGRPINSTGTYKIATNSYLASGGNGYKIFLKDLQRYDTSISQRDALIQYIQSLGGRIKPKRQGRIKISAHLKGLVLYRPAA